MRVINELVLFLELFHENVFFFSVGNNLLEIISIVTHNRYCRLNSGTLFKINFALVQDK